MTHQEAGGGPEPAAVLLRRLRQARRLSQLQVAEKLCEVSGRPTVSRHEVSRWERGQRLPGQFWLSWLAVVLEAPLEKLEAAVIVAGGQVSRPGAGKADQRWPWRPLSAVDLLAELDHGNVQDVRELTHAWLPGPPDRSGSLSSGRTTAASGQEPAIVDGNGRDVLSLLEAGLGRLRRADDVLGGVELAGRVDRRLRGAIPVLTKIGSGRSELRNRALRLVAGYAQLAGWVHADGGNARASRQAYRVGLRAAAAAGDKAMVAHLLGSHSSLSLAVSDPPEALLLARTGLVGVGGGGSPLLRALLLQRTAMAAARLGEKREAEVTLVQAERAADRSVRDNEPEWLHWLDHAELTAMTGRCLAVLGRHLRAARLLAGRHCGAGSRTAALYGGWLARCYVELGEIEQACRIAGRVLPVAVSAGSVRVADGVRYLHPLLLRYRGVEAVREYERQAEAAVERLPVRAARTPGPGFFR